MTIVTDLMRDREQPAVVYGIVRFAPGGDRQVLDIVITFATAAAADGYAAGQGWADYEVAPARFFVRERPSALDAMPPPTRPAPPGARPSALDTHLPPSPDLARPDPAGSGLGHPDPARSGPGRPGLGRPDPRPVEPDHLTGRRPPGPARWSPATDRPPTGGPALPKQGHRPVSADPAGPPGSAETGETTPTGVAGQGPARPGEPAGRTVAAPDPGVGGPVGPGVTMTAWGTHRWAIALTAGSDPGDALRAVGRLPAGLVFAAAYGDVDVVLVYGGPPGGPPPGTRPTVAEELLDPPPEGALWARWMTSSERDAYRAGRDAALDEVRRALT
ncbi:conserved hypothetical protein [Frankia canadensis]|uniref:Uncharacterized protein n=1 Tax=Frankia canadensis TaxID=1836972 RepID=A0A2I2KYB2_9ACTN|nr:hypothetical protein [Frankia canadensis]SNQ50662.1 conserved hypothetical protein [Frankia canadensis]SOU57952.1 conserved hypothetical protein [Frankia canadensis]